MHRFVEHAEYLEDLQRSNSPFHVSTLNKNFTPVAWSHYKPQNIPLLYTGLFSSREDFLNSLNGTITEINEFVKNVSEYFLIFKKSETSTIKHKFLNTIKPIISTIELMKNNEEIVPPNLEFLFKSLIEANGSSQSVAKKPNNDGLLFDLAKDLESLNDLIKTHGSQSGFKPLTNHKIEEFIRYAYWQGKFEQLGAIKQPHQRPILRSRISEDADGNIILKLGEIADISCYDVGINYLYGIDREPIDHKQAFFYLQKASQLNDSPNRATALAALGKCYMRGFGVDRDISKGKSLFKEAIPMLQKMAKKGDPEAKFHLADICFDGQMMERNHQQIVEWLLPAALSNGFVPAQILLAKEYMRVTPAGDYDYPNNTEHLLIRLLKLASTGGATESTLLLGRLMVDCRYSRIDSTQSIIDGTYGIDGNIKQMFNFLTVAAKNGSAEAMLYLTGLYIQQGDKELALEYLKQANEKGSARAAFYAGSIYFYGKLWGQTLAPINKDMGEKFLRQSAEKGCPEAQTRLATLIIVNKIKPKHEFEAISWLGHAIRHTPDHEYLNHRENHKVATELLRENLQKYVEHLIEFIQSNKKDCTELNLEGWPLDDYSTEDKFADISDILEALEDNTTITDLDLRHINLSPKSYNQIALFLLTNRTVKAISLDEPKDEKSKRIMGDVITPCLQLRNNKEIQCSVVDLHGYQTQLINKLFSPVIFYCYNHLTNLNLSSIKAEDKLLFDMSPHLFQIHSLQVLNLSNNRLSALAFSEIGGALSKNEHLRQLNLSHNKMSLNKTQLIREAKHFYYTDDESKEERLEINLTGNYLAEDCDPVLRKQDLGDGVISKNRVSFYSHNPAKTPVYSMLAPNHILKVGGENAWVVALGSYKEKQHAIIFYEGLRVSGQRFFYSFDVVPDKSNSCQVSIRQKVFLGKGIIRKNAKSVVEIDDDNCYIRSFIVGADQGEKLKKNIMRDKNNGLVNFWLFKNSPEGDYVNCLQWAKKQLKAIGITDIPDSIYPKKAAKPHEQTKLAI